MRCDWVGGLACFAQPGVACWCVPSGPPLASAIALEVLYPVTLPLCHPSHTRTSFFIRFLRK